MESLVTMGLFLLGLVIGGQVNRGIYRLAWDARPIGPWSAPHPEAPPRHWSDRLPVFGWFGLSREQHLHGGGYWIRPLLIELAVAIGLPLFLDWCLGYGLHRWPVGGTEKLVAPDRWVLYAQFLRFSVLALLMCVATFIDFDEKTIPDAIVVAGFLLALLMSATLPQGLLSDLATRITGEYAADEMPPLDAVTIAPVPLSVTSPLAEWAPGLDGVRGLAYGGIAYASWWWALMIPRKTWFRRGWGKGVALYCAALRRHPDRYLVAGLWLFGTLALAAVWQWGPVSSWRAVLTSLVGMVFGGGLTWSFRIVASRVLGQEALGFGDVTLMGMIGAFVGWQPALLVFFLAPFAALLIAVTQWFWTRNHEIAFGPYLCLATVILVLGWTDIWTRCQHYFLLGLWIPAMIPVCLALMASMLGGWQWVKGRWLIDP